MSEMIGRLRVALGLETAAFEKGAKRASAEINTFGSKAEQAGFKVGSMAKAVAVGGAAIAGSAIVAQIKDMVTAGLEYASSLGEQAAKLGVTAKAMQEYRAVASQVGLSNEEMDAALAKLTRTVGDAATGSKKAQGAFDALGISVRDANGNVKDAGDLIPEIAAALEKVPSPAERASRLVDLFGKSGQKLAPLMAEGAGGINKLREEARQLGMVLSDEQIQKADATADKIAQLNAQFNARIAGVVADNADAIMGLVNALSALADKMLRLINMGAAFAKSPAGKLLGNLGEAASYLNPVTQGMKMLDVADRAMNGKGGASPVAPKASVSPAWGKTTTAPLLQSGSVYTGLRTNFAGASDMMPSAASTFAGMQAGNAAGLFAGATDGADAQQKVLQELSQQVDETSDTIKVSADEIETANERVQRSFEEMANTSLNALQSLVSAVQSGDVVGILQSVLGLGQQLGVFSGGGGFGSASSINADALSSLRGSSLASLPAYAGGTSFHPGGLAMVGERGPEIVNLPRGAGVTPNHALGGTVNNYFSGNLLTPEFWQRITSQDVQAAQAGGELGYRKVLTKGRRRLA